MNKKKTLVKIIVITVCLLLIAGVVLAVTYNRDISVGTTSEEKAQTREKVLEDNKYMHVEEDASGDKVPVPNGFVGSKVAGENEIDTGYVIYSGEEEVNDSNVLEAQKTRNQYVWVPVPEISKFYGTDANGKR